MKELALKINVSEAIKGVKRFDWEGDYRKRAREFLRSVMEGHMNNWIDLQLSEISSCKEGVSPFLLLTQNF